jgi:succinylarginine dihydrolase
MAFMENNVTEVILIGLPGPTHHYGGLSADNVASNRNRGLVSNPKLAAQQAISLARTLGRLGLVAGFLPPQLRPHLPLLRERFAQCATPEALIATAAKEDASLLEKASSSSAMWAANAATVTAAVDDEDGKLHITPANLHTNLHRRIEAAETHAVLSSLFAQVPNCVVHPPLPAHQRDEGAANHTRLTPSHSTAGLNLFVYGADGSKDDAPSARQDLAASRAIAEAHHVTHPLFIRQNPAIIASGVFHNDVIAVGNQHVLLAHERAFARHDDLTRIAHAYEQACGSPLCLLTVTDAQLSVSEAVDTYFFNSQLVTKPDGKMAIIAPTEVSELYDGKALALMHALRDAAGNPIDEIITLDLRQSMRNGGGPACLRLRVPLREDQLNALRHTRNTLTSDALMDTLETLIDRHYPDSLSAQDLADPAHYHNCQRLLDKLHALMQLRIGT